MGIRPVRRDRWMAREVGEWVEKFQQKVRGRIERSASERTVGSHHNIVGWRKRRKRRRRRR